jgi:hypothetical protein
MPLTFKDRVKQAVGTGGSGALTLGAAASGFQAFAAGDDGKLFPYVIEDGTAWETGYGTYTHSGTSFARTTRTASSTGSALTVSASAYVYVDMVADLVAQNDVGTQTYITGCLVTKHTGANTLDISAGAAYVPSAGKVVAYAGESGVSAGTLGASQWNQVYLNGDGTLTVTNNADPPSTTYAGNARKDGSKRRWLGSFLTTSGSALYDVIATESAAGVIEITNNSAATASPFRIVNGGTNAAFGSISSFAGACPKYATIEACLSLTLDAGAGSGAVHIYTSTDGTNINASSLSAHVTGPGAYPAASLWSAIERTTPGIYYQTNGNAYIDVTVYRMVR